MSNRTRENICGTHVLWVFLAIYWASKLATMLRNRVFSSQVCRLSVAKGTLHQVYHVKPFFLLPLAQPGKHPNISRLTCQPENKIKFLICERPKKHINWDNYPVLCPGQRSLLILRDLIGYLTRTSWTAKNLVSNLAKSLARSCKAFS